MFVEIFLFEIRNRIRRPAVYLYFLGIFIFYTLRLYHGVIAGG